MVSQIVAVTPETQRTKDEHTEATVCPLLLPYKHSLVFIVHLLFWQRGFRMLFQMISNPIESVHLLSPTGRHGILVTWEKAEEESLKHSSCRPRNL